MRNLLITISMLFFGIILGFSISLLYAAGLCTGFFITSDGYIGTAGHCQGRHITVIYNGKKLPARIVSVDHKNDSMLLKVTDKNVPYFSISLIVPKVGQYVAYIGYPDAFRYGFHKRTFYGRLIRKDNEFMYVDMFSKPGTSGSAVYDSNGNVVGILTDGVFFANVFESTGVRFINSLVIQAIKAHASIVLVKDSFDKIDSNVLNSLYKTNSNKVVLLYIEQ